MRNKLITYIVKMILWILGTWQAVIWIERLYEVKNTRISEILTAVAVLVVLDIVFYVLKNIFNKRLKLVSKER